MKNWYWKKFEKMFEAFMKRKALTEAKEVKLAMISGLWGNPNFDDNKNTRSKALKDIEESYQEAVNVVYNGVESHEIDMDQPFWANVPKD